MMIRTCPHCGEILWERSPRLKAIYDHVVNLKRFTTRDVADHFEISIQNANNQLTWLVSENLISKATTEAHPTGGIVTVWQGEHETMLKIVSLIRND